ncbi:MAG: hypothetical protein MJ252_24835, partial [archaeon]|nr:hypothetical protein [archaeon]
MAEMEKEASGQYEEEIETTTIKKINPESFRPGILSSGTLNLNDQRAVYNFTIEKPNQFLSLHEEPLIRIGNKNVYKAEQKILDDRLFNQMVEEKKKNIKTISENEFKKEVEKDRYTTLQKILLNHMNDPFYYLDYNRQKKIEEEKKTTITKKKIKKEGEGGGKGNEDDFQTVPLGEGEDPNSILNRKAGRDYNSIISSNNNMFGMLGTDLDYDTFLKNALTGLKYNRIEAPKQSFIQSKDLKLRNDEFDQNRIFFDKEKYRKAREQKYENEIIQNEGETVKNKNKVFDELYNKNLEGLQKLEDDNEKGFDYLYDVGRKMELNKMFNRLTINNLKILKNDREQIKKILMDDKNRMDYFDDDLERRNKMEEDREKALLSPEDNDMIKNILKNYKTKGKGKLITDEEIDELAKIKGIGKRKYYND